MSILASHSSCVRSISTGWNFSPKLDSPLPFCETFFLLSYLAFPPPQHLAFLSSQFAWDVGCDLFYLSGPWYSNHITISLNGIICPLQTITVTNFSINMRIPHFSPDENIGHCPHRRPWCETRVMLSSFIMPPHSPPHE